jgi:hypothetical protein
MTLPASSEALIWVLPFRRKSSSAPTMFKHPRWVVIVLVSLIR